MKVYFITKLKHGNKNKSADKGNRCTKTAERLVTEQNIGSKLSDFGTPRQIQTCEAFQKGYNM